jgi:hypothetical protein
MGCTNMNDTVYALARKLAKDYHIDIALEELNVTGTGYVGAHATSAEKKSGFIKMLDTLKAGKTYVFVDHPAITSPEMKAIHHIGYENVEEDRQGVVELFTDKEIKELIRQKNIQLISYKNLTE